MAGSWARDPWSDACEEREAGLRLLALARGPDWSGGGGSLHPYPRPVPARHLTSFAFGTKQASSTHVSITPGGARAEERRFQNVKQGPKQASAQPGRLSGPMGLRGLRRPRPCPSHRADSPGGGPRIAVSGQGSPAAQGWFPRPQCTPRSVTCFQVSMGFCQRRGAAPSPLPPPRPPSPCSA